MRRSRALLTPGVILTALIALTLALEVRSAPAQTPEPRTGIRVIGQGQVTAQPDVAVLTLGASARRDRPDVAFDRVERLMTAAMEVFRANGVAERDIRTLELSLFQEFRPGTQEEPEPVFLGWRARHTVSVRMRDFSRIGRIVGDAVAALEDAGEVHGISFTIENPDAHIAQAREAAIRDARQKAERMAAGLGARLGTVTFAQETAAPFPGAVPFATPARTPTPIAAPIRGAIPVVPAQISPGEQVFSVTIEVHFAIEGVPLS